MLQMGLSDGVLHHSLLPKGPITEASKIRGMMSINSVDEQLPLGRLTALGIQHVLVMYAGAIAVPLIIGRALKLPPEEVAYLISADLFCCGIVTLIQSFGATQWFGIKLPVMMGVTFASVAPMLAIAGANPGAVGANLIFGSVIAAGIFGLLIAPVMSRLLRFFPPIVTGSIILVIGITLMRIGINWVFGNPVGPGAPMLVNAEHTKWLEAVKALGSAVPAIPDKLAIAASVPNTNYADPTNIWLSALVLAVILAVAKFAKGFVQNIAVLIGILVGGVVAALIGKMTFAKVATAPILGITLPFHFGMPTFDFWMIVSMCIVMLVVMIESTGMFLALGDMTGKRLSQADLSAGLRTDGLGAIIGGIFNTFPYTSFSQNVGLVGVTGVRSRFVAVAGGIILIVMSLLPKLSALVEALPTAVLGGAGLVMFGMVAATGIRILGGVDFKTNRNNAFIVAVAVSFGLIPLIAPSFDMWMPASIKPLIDSGILLAAIVAVALNLFFNGASGDVGGAKTSGMASGHH